jgi:hypothetical protein
MTTTINTWPKIFSDGFVQSNYKLHCFVCGNTIHRGDDIAQCAEYGGHTSMTLRARVYKTSFYTPDTGARWVHKNCNPGCWTTYNVLEQVDEDNREMNEVMDYISIRLGIATNTVSLGEFIKKAYRALGKPILLGLTLIEELYYIKTVLELRDL